MPPLYLQVKDHILSNIQSGNWPVGARVPSEHELVAQFNISRMTANRALRELADQGLVRRVAGSGSFVAAPKATQPTSEIQFFHNADKSLAKDASAITRLTATPVLRDAFEDQSLFELLQMRIIYSEHGTAIHHEEIFMRAELATQEFSQASVDDFLRSSLGADHLKQVVAAHMPDAIIQRALNIRSTEPCLSMRNFYSKQQKILAITTRVSPASRFSLESSALL